MVFKIFELLLFSWLKRYGTLARLLCLTVAFASYESLLSWRVGGYLPSSLSRSAITGQNMLMMSPSRITSLTRRLVHWMQCMAHLMEWKCSFLQWRSQTMSCHWCQPTEQMSAWGRRNFHHGMLLDNWQGFYSNTPKLYTITTKISTVLTTTILRDTLLSVIRQCGQQKGGNAVFW